MDCRVRGVAVIHYWATFTFLTVAYNLELGLSKVTEPKNKQTNKKKPKVTEPVRDMYKVLAHGIMETEKSYDLLFASCRPRKVGGIVWRPENQEYPGQTSWHIQLHTNFDCCSNMNSNAGPSAHPVTRKPCLKGESKVGVLTQHTHACLGPVSFPGKTGF